MRHENGIEAVAYGAGRVERSVDGPSRVDPHLTPECSEIIPG